MPQANTPSEEPSGRAPNGEALPRLGDFEIIERIGQGAVGAVFKARQRSMDRLVAVKVLKPRLAEDPAYVERFWREARAAARLSHPNIVLAIDAGQAHGYYYFVMEYVEGHPVSLLRKAAVFEERRALEIVRQVAEALDYAWTEERIVHRDVKPGNIIITPDGTAKLADLGLAQDALEAAEEESEDGMVLGTPLYVAPEQIRREPDLDVRCDLYALGATLFHMVTGRPPFRDADSKAILRKHLHEPAPDPREFRPELSEGIAQIILKLLAKDRDERYPDARALIADIDAVLTTGRLPGRAPAALHVPRRRPRATLSNLIVLCFVLGALGGAAIAIWHLSTRERSRGTRLPTSADAATSPATAVVTEPPSQGKEPYDKAVAFSDAHPAEHVQAVALFKAVEIAHPGTTYARLAVQRREHLETVLDETAEDTLKTLTRKAERLVAGGHYAKALAAFGRFPGGLATAEWRGRVAEARKAVEEMARRRFEAALAPGARAAAGGKLDDALKLYRAIPSPPIAAWRDEVAERIAAVERRIRERIARAKAETEAAYLRLMTDVASLYRKRQYDAAAALLKAKLDAAGDHRADLEGELAELGRLRAFWRAVEQGARKAIGKPYAVRGIPGHISDVQGGSITIKTAGRPFSERLANLRWADALAFALSALDGRQGALAGARFLIAEGQAAEAEQRLARLEGEGADVAALRARIELLCRGELRAALRVELSQARKAGDPAAALRAFVERYKGQPAAADLCAEARRLLEMPVQPEHPAAAEALPARLRLACDGTLKLFVNGKPVASGEHREGQLQDIELKVSDGDVLACEATSQSGHRGLYALLSVAKGRYLVATDSSWLVSGQPADGWHADPKPEGTWQRATLAYSPHVKPGYTEAGRGLPGYWIWGGGERCCFHKVVRLTRTADEEARREREREQELTRQHGEPARAKLLLACTGAYQLTQNGRPAGCAAAPVPGATYELSVRDGDVLGVRGEGGERGWLDARLDVEGVSVPIRADRSWVWAALPAPKGWDRRGPPGGAWRAAEPVVGEAQRIWGKGAELLFRKRLDLEALRSRDADAPELVHGRIQRQSRWHSEILYDLSDPGQLADWQSAGDLVWAKGRFRCGTEPVVTRPFSTRDVEIEIELEPVVDLIIGLWGDEIGRRKGYTLSVSDSRRATVILRRHSHTLWMERVTTASAATRRVTLRRYGKLFTVSIDGRRVFSSRDRDPLDPDGAQRPGFIVPAHGKGAVKAIRVAGTIDWRRGRPRRGPRPPEAGGDREPE